MDGQQQLDGRVDQFDGRVDKASVERLAKVIFAGGAGVGKTCLLSRLFSDKFDANKPPTIGCDFQFKRYQVDDKSIGVTLWDTAGSERFSAMTSSYFRGAHGIILA
ncbi:hypothetical protein DUNSADRAFT_5253 [Dunaliella salina]|uniref:Uncharacterized protein n=1 Tax=Dunaliella salina TaxID=3046 RepID=A0ABQ7GQN8_DUNSA|nr:hypothetical protein DUNSADRAFT_5253 [Dunaliella salina]|eukprot:KAF5836922.1 hypothetical protein DUNSADRAFT_5253 [Dunaliella salina]